MRLVHAAFVASAFLALFSVSPIFAACVSTDPTYNLCLAMQNLCAGIQSLIPVASMLMLVIAAVIYAAGQMMGAETRARANVWATAALTGALIGILIVAISPAVLQTIAGGSNTINCGAAGGGGGGGGNGNIGIG